MPVIGKTLYGALRSGGTGKATGMAN